MTIQNLQTQVNLENERRFKNLLKAVLEFRPSNLDIRVFEQRYDTPEEWVALESDPDWTTRDRTIDESTIDGPTINALKGLCEIYYDGTGESKEWNNNQISALMRQVAEWLDSLK